MRLRAVAELNLEWIEAGSLKTQAISPEQVTKHPGMTRLGRDPNRCDVVLADGSVSGLHVQIGFEPTQGFFLENLRESNPPIINNQPLTTGRVYLLSENTIQLGNIQIRAIAINTASPPSTNALPETEIQIPQASGPANQPYSPPPAQQGYQPLQPNYPPAGVPPTSPPPYANQAPAYVPPQTDQYNYATGNVAPEESSSGSSKKILTFLILGAIVALLFGLAWPTIRSFLGISDSSVVPSSSSQSDTTESVSSDNTQELTMANLVSYEHPSGLYALDIPDNWTPIDNSQAGEILIQGWRHPRLNSYVILRIFATESPLGRQDLQDFAARVVDDLFGELGSFDRGDPQPLLDQSIRVLWEAQDGDDFLVASTFVRQDGLNLSTLTVWVPDGATDVDALQSDIDEIVASLDVDPNIDIP